MAAFTAVRRGRVAAGLRRGLATRDRRDRLDEPIIAMAADGEFTPVVARLGCLCRVATLTAFGLAVEIGDYSFPAAPVISATESPAIRPADMPCMRMCMVSSASIKFAN